VKRFLSCSAALVFSCSPVPVLLLAFLTAGCGDPDVLPRRAQSVRVAQDDDQRMFGYVAENLQRLAEYGPPGVRDQKEIMEQIVERLNDWSQDAAPIEKWQLDRLISTLPPDLQKNLLARLPDKRFDQFDGFFLREAVWLRDAAATAVASAGSPGVPQYYQPDDDRQKVAALFDWTVRNIQLDPSEASKDGPPTDRFPLRPWEVLLMGHGTELERIWVFMLLARQQHLDVVLLATPDPKTPNQFRVWAPAHLHEKNLYLYDMGLGLPLPGPKGKGIATLQEAAADESVLAQLDLDGAPYPVRAKDLKDVLALTEADVPYLSQRMKLVEAHLTGERKMVLSATPARLAEKLQGMPHVRTLRIWPFPFVNTAERMGASDAARRAFAQEWTIMTMPLVKHIPKVVEEGREEEDEPKLVVRERIVFPLWWARQRHFQGRYDAPEKRGAGVENEAAQESAKSLYLDAREAVQGVRGANAAAVPAERRKLMEDMRDFATYWLGLVNYDQGNFDVANQFFEPIVNDGKEDRFYPGAIYNLARTRQAEGKAAEAIELYENPAISMPHGCRLRAKWLKDGP